MTTMAAAKLTKLEVKNLTQGLFQMLLNKILAIQFYNISDL
jgi:hypothetical protein